MVVCVFTWTQCTCYLPVWFSLSLSFLLLFFYSFLPSVHPSVRPSSHPDADFIHTHSYLALTVCQALGM